MSEGEIVIIIYFAVIAVGTVIGMLLIAFAGRDKS